MSSCSERVFIPVVQVGRDFFIRGRLNCQGNPRFIRVGGVKIVDGVGMALEVDLVVRYQDSVVVRFANGETAHTEEAIPSLRISPESKGA